jgi:very-short-patch-repair endonuclease/endogenous inhibitor of DNA gyrase (YacG/DUF329 family)
MSYCKNCGEESSNYGSGIFCSKKCQLEYSYKNRKIEKQKCEFCEKEFKEKQALTNHLKHCIRNPENDNFIDPNEDVECPTCKRHHHREFNSFSNFCSRACANSRGKYDEDKKKKISEGVKNSGKFKQGQEKKKKLIREKKLPVGKDKNGNPFFFGEGEKRYGSYICKKCGKEFNDPKHSNRKEIGLCPECYPTTDLLRDIQLKRIADGTHTGWNARTLEPSFPEKYWIGVLENNSLHYEREKKIGKYFCDFYFEDKKLDLEIDGKQHDYEDRKLRDIEKEKFLKEQGISTYRIRWNYVGNENGKLLMKQKIDDFLEYLHK